MPYLFLGSLLLNKNHTDGAADLEAWQYRTFSTMDVPNKSTYFLLTKDWTLSYYTIFRDDNFKRQYLRMDLG